MLKSHDRVLKSHGRVITMPFAPYASDVAAGLEDVFQWHMFFVAAIIDSMSLTLTLSMIAELLDQFTYSKCFSGIADTADIPSCSKTCQRDDAFPTEPILRGHLCDKPDMLYIHFACCAALKTS